MKKSFTYIESTLYRNLMFQTKVKGFTLAEILITIGIIGVIAAMTIPKLIMDINAIRFRSQFFKSYSTIQQTVKTMEADDEALVSPGSYGNQSRQENSFYSNFLRYHSNTFDCGDYFKGNHKGNGCFDFRGESHYTMMDGKTNYDSSFLDDGQILMPDGSLILFEQPTRLQDRIWIYVDLNSALKPPNRFGYDIFCFQLTDDGLKPMGAAGTTYVDTESDKYCDKNGSGEMNGIACSNEVIKQGPRNYYKWLHSKGN